MEGADAFSPPGYEFKASQDDFVARAVQAAPKSPAAVDKELMRRKVWELGKSPFSNIFSTLLMLYFSGDHLSIMSLMLCAMMVSGPLRAFLSFKATFQPYDEALGSGDPVVRKSKLVFVGINLAVLAVAVWKIGRLGILPFTEADALRHLPVWSADGHAQINVSF